MSWITSTTSQRPPLRRWFFFGLLPDKMKRIYSILSPFYSVRKPHNIRDVGGRIADRDASPFFMSEEAYMFGTPYPQQFQQFSIPCPTYQEVEGPDSIQMLRIPPNSKHVYFDRRLDRFYSVSTDAVGAKFVEAYDFAPAQEPKQPEYLTVEAFDEWRSKYEQSISQPAAAEPDAISKAARKPAGSGAANPADAPIRANHAKPVQPSPAMG